MFLIGAALLVGLVLGLLGAGGGIITVPALIYGAQFAPRQAIAHSLAVICLIAFISAFREVRNKHVQLGKALPFAAGGITGSFLGARLATSVLTEDFQIMTLVAVIFTASALMFKSAIRHKPLVTHEINKPPSIKISLLVLIGFGTGMISGIAGVGGGFLIVPVLVLLAKFDMKTAVGTALAVIGINAFGGVLGYLSGLEFNFPIIMLFVGCGLVGSTLGSHVRMKLPSRTLKFVFASFMILMGCYLVFDKVLT